MKIFTVAGMKNSGKTTVVEALLRELTRRGRRCASLKDIHFEGFMMDTPGSNSDRHRAAGAYPVIARGLRETDVLFSRRLPVAELEKFCEGADFLVMEGVMDEGFPMILTANSEAELEERWNPHVFCVSGRIAEELSEYRSVPAVNVLNDAGRLVDIIDEFFDGIENVKSKFNAKR